MSCLNSGRILKELNRTFIVLISKKESPEKIEDYRPISLCNVAMRIISKCLANRMRKIIGKVVGEYQNAFIPGRSIQDSILVAQEIIYNINNHKKAK